METFDYKSQFEKMKKDTAAAIAKALDIQDSKANRQIRVKEVWVDDTKDPGDFESQREAVRRDRTWGVPVYASLEMLDRKTGKVLSSNKRIRVATLPKDTRLGSFIVEGKHYQIQSQFRRKPGVYITEKKNRQRKAEINISGRPFDLVQDAAGAFQLMRGPNNPSGLPLYPILSSMGVTDSALARAWGEDILAANKMVTPAKAATAVRSAAEYFTQTKPSSPDTAGKAIRNFLETTELKPEVTKDTLGHEASKASPEVIVMASQQLLKASRGEREIDDRQALQYKKVLSPADLLRERLIQPGGELAAPLAALRKKIGFKLGNQRNPPTDIAQVVKTDDFSSLFTSFFTKSSLADMPDQTNPIDMLNGLSKITILGEGGVKDEQKVRAEERGVHPSHLGFLDPIHTPDSSKIGVVGHLPIGVTKSGDELKMRVRDPKKGTIRLVSPVEVRNMVLAFPDQYQNGKFVDDKVKALVNGETRLIESSKVDAVFATPKQAFSISSNAIPFLPSTHGVRGQMATKMLEQALPLARHADGSGREAPLVQVRMGNGTLEDAIGEEFSIQALEDGVVEQVTPSRIVIKTKDGKVEQPIYNNLPLNKKSFLHADPRVAVGDKVKKGQVLADSTFTHDGTLALGTNLTAAYIPYKGLNFEDGIVITETAAKKLSSEHMHQFAASKSKGWEFSRQKYVAAQPNKLTLEQQDKLDEDGVVRKGQILQPGDPLWVGIRENRYDPDYLAMRKLRPDAKPFKGQAEEWNSEVTGRVVDVVKSGNSVKVYVRTIEPAQIGDKLSNRQGAKGIITRIIPDGEAPRTANDEPVEILLNPHGVVGRMNPSQLLETAAAKVAKATGKPYVVDNFSGEDYTKGVVDALAKAGIADTEPLFDPHTKESLGNVLVGPQYVLKLDKQATKQFSARSPGGGSYDAATRSPTSGEGGSKSLDLLTFYSMLSHGSRANLKEMSTFKATQNPEFWRWIEGGAKAGLLPPLPEPTFAYKKFEAYMKGAGVNMTRNGSKMALGPMTDREVMNLSNGEVKDAFFARSKDLRPEPGGLTDPITFGPTQERWGHLELAEPMPNPVFEDPIKRLVGLKNSQFTGFVRGELFLNPDSGEMGPAMPGGLTGGAAIKHLLSQIDVDQQTREWTDRAKKATSPAKLDEANKSLRYLNALKKTGLRPEDAYIQHKLPVLPPQFRPVIELPDGTLSTGGLNNLYRDVTLVNNELKWQKDVPFLPEEVKADIRQSVYDGMKALSGLGNPIAKYKGGREPKGFITQLKGKPAKEGFFQYEVIRRNQEPVGRGTIIPDPKLGLDEVGLPEDMAWTLFDKFVVRRLTTASGKTPIEAGKEVEARTPMALAALQAEMEARPVLLNRAPSLHKFSILAFKPKIVSGKAIQIPPLVVKGFGADFDGDAMTVHVPVLQKAIDEAQKMLPSRNIYNPGTGQVMVQPQNEAALGLYRLSLDAAGRDQIRGALPARLQSRPDQVLDKEGLRTLLADVSKDSPHDYGHVVDQLKEMGDEHSYKSGFTVSLADLVPNVPEKAALMADTWKKVRAINTGKAEGHGQAVDIIDKADKQIDTAVNQQMDEQGNNLRLMVRSGARGNSDQLKQIVSAPFMVNDHRGQPMSYPITNSFAHGLPFSDYWSTLYGARSVAVDKQLQTALPGAFNKDIMATAITNVISGDDCHTTEGIKLNILEQGKDAEDRFLAKDVRVGGSVVAHAGAPVTHGLLNLLRGRKIQDIEVRSPLTCKKPEGTCAKCFGLNTDGQLPSIGHNVGAESAQGLSEPLTQMTLRTFHSGGLAGTRGIVSGLAKIDQLFKMHKIERGEAPLASGGGTIDRIDPAPGGLGRNIFIGKNKLYVPEELWDSKKAYLGRKVEKGDVLANGLVDADKLLQLKGMLPAQEYIVDEIQREYGKQGVQLKRRGIETVIRSVANTTKVLDPGDSDFIHGDTIPWTVAEDFNRQSLGSKPLHDAMGHTLREDVGSVKAGTVIDEHIKKTLERLGKTKVEVGPRPIAHAPFLKGLERIPILRSDWMSQMGYRDLAKAVISGATQMKESDLHGYAPVPAFAYGAEFGEAPKGRSEKEGVY